MFEVYYEEWLHTQLAASVGDRKRRLEDERFAERLFLEQIWWPAIGNFEDLHGEYEVSDFKDGKRFLDYAFIRAPYQVCFEIDGFGPHCRDIDRNKFADGLMRQNHLILDGWIVIRLSYDDVKKKPRQCQQIIHQLFGRLYSLKPNQELTPNHKEILRYMSISQKSVSPNEISTYLHIGIKKARKLLKELVDKQYLVPATSSQQRIRVYKLNSTISPFSYNFN
ncbi:MAG: DNA-binding response regulator [Candidatus Pristimantibacillus sp.]